MCGNVTGSSGLWGKADPTSSFIAKRTGYDPAHLFTDAPDPNAAAEAAAKAEAARQAEINATIGKINDLFSSPALQQQYTKYGQDTFNLLKNNLDTQTANEGRTLKFNLSRSGNVGGSEDVRQHGLLQKDYNAGLLSDSTQSQGAVAGLESADNATKNALDSMALNGLSATDATTQALAAQQEHEAQAKAGIMPQTADSLFGDLASIYANKQAGAGASAANAAGSGGQDLGSNFLMPAQQPTIAMDDNFNIYDPNANPSGG